MYLGRSRLRRPRKGPAPRSPAFIAQANSNERATTDKASSQSESFGRVPSAATAHAHMHT